MLGKLLTEGHWVWYFAGVVTVPIIIIAAAYYFRVKEQDEWDIHD